MNFKFAFNLGGGNLTPARHKLPVAATQTLVRGDALVMSSGRVAKAGAASGVVVGIMAQDSDGAAGGTLVEVDIVTPEQVWEATATADATAVVLNGTLTYDLTAAQLVDVADTTGGSLTIVGLKDSVTNIFVQFTACFFSR